MSNIGEACRGTDSIRSDFFRGGVPFPSVRTMSNPQRTIAQYRTIPYEADKNFDSRVTHTGELDATVTALGSSTLLLQVKVTELTTGGLDDANLVGPRVVPIGANSSMFRSKSM